MKTIKSLVITAFVLLPFTAFSQSVGGGGGPSITTRMVQDLSFLGDDVGGGGGPKAIEQAFSSMPDVIGGGGGQSLRGPGGGGGMIGTGGGSAVTFKGPNTGGGIGRQGHIVDAKIPKIVRISIDDIEGVINYNRNFIDRMQLKEGNTRLSLDGVQVEQDRHGEWVHINPALIREVLIDGEYHSAKELVEGLGGL